MPSALAVNSTLAAGAVKGRSPAIYAPAHAALAARTDIPLAAIDAKALLEIAQLLSLIHI